MKIVVTGSTGFLGSEIVKQCEYFGYEPILLIRKESNKKRLEFFKNITVFEYNNFNDENLIKNLKLEKPNCFIHSAWKGIDRNTRNEESQINYNLPFSLASIELANAIQCKHWIGIGSLTEYGILNTRIDENCVTNPHTIYGKSKLATCWASSGLCQALNMNWSWVRVGSIFGPEDNDYWLIPYVIKSVLNGIPPKLTPSDQIWDYLYVTDAANAILSIIQNNASGIYNLGSGEGHTIKYIVNSIVEKINKDFQLQFGGIPYSENQIMHLESDIKKIIGSTGWRPETTLIKGLEMTIEKIKSNNQ
jgi:nucleoside-diphosphate-sugar epimerase